MDNNSLPERINNFVSKQQIQKGWKGALVGGIGGALATGGHPIGAIGGAYLGHKLIGFGPRGKKKIKASRPAKSKYTPGSARRIK